MKDYRNTSDLIEAFFKEQLLNVPELEIRRSEVALHFNCVPSQINYVINTRFTLQQGYIVESKRGGGGYIRISKTLPETYFEELKNLEKQIPRVLSQKESLQLLEKLNMQQWISKREEELLKDLLSREALQAFVNEKELRAVLCKRLLKKLISECKE